MHVHFFALCARSVKIATLRRLIFRDIDCDMDYFSRISSDFLQIRLHFSQRNLLYSPIRDK